VGAGERGRAARQAVPTPPRAAGPPAHPRAAEERRRESRIEDLDCMALTNKRVCITGGAGFIGSHLAEQLIADNEIVVYDNLHRNAIQFPHLHGHPDLTFIKGDVMDAEATRRAVAGCQVVIHCAAIAGVYSVDRNAVTTIEVNLLGTNSVVRAALAAGV